MKNHILLPVILSANFILAVVGQAQTAGGTNTLAGTNGVDAGDVVVQQIPFTVQSGGSGSSCPGSWTGYAKMTNSAGTFWLTPPTNAVSGTFTDTSGFAAPYVSVTYVKRKSDGVSWCDTNSVTFPATNSAAYSLTLYVKSPLPPPTNGQPVSLQLTWQ